MSNIDYKAAAVTMLARANEEQSTLIYEILLRLVGTTEPIPEKKVEVRTAFEVMSDVEDAILKVNELPDVIQLLIESLNLDAVETTEAEAYDLVHRKGMIYNVLTLVQRNLWETIEAIDNISIRKAQTETASTDQSN